MNRIICLFIKMLFLLLCLLPFCVSQGPPPPPDDGEFTLNFNSPIYVANEESKEFVDTSKVSVERHNETIAFMSGDLIFLQELSGKLILRLMLLKESGAGKFDVITSHDVCDLCKELGDEDSPYNKYLRPMGLPNACPIAAGPYAITNFILDASDMELSSNHEGLYEAQMFVFYQTGEDCQMDRQLIIHFCIDVVVERL